ncbi:MAG TPA: cytochrome c biogenesis protein CcsA [Candidatus Thermoplasmatota archaeon]|nr:cytochrome c biogenesis protein CcsA [Candidatus Thermoplasmatota archaeon]
MNGRTVLVAVAVVAMLAHVVLALVVAPQAKGFVAPVTQRIFYFHVPSAWIGYLAFAVTAFASARFLHAPAARWDHLARSSAEVGTVFSVVALVTGLAWSRLEFAGYDPFTDAKVITLVVLILAYLAYLSLRAGVADDDRRGRLAAVFGLLAVVGVPLSYLASSVSIHPDFTRPGSGLDPGLGIYLGFGVVAFTLLYAALAALRYDLAVLEARLVAASETLER